MTGQDIEKLRAAYLPPCSGGRGHVYFADIKAVQKTEGEDPKALAETRFLLGRY